MGQEKPRPYMTMLKIASSSLLLYTVIILAVFLANRYCGLEINASGSSLWLGLVGSGMAFVGSGFVADATTRYGAQNTPQWKWGNATQSLGFSLTLIALLVK